MEASPVHSPLSTDIFGCATAHESLRQWGYITIGGGQIAGVIRVCMALTTKNIELRRRIAEIFRGVLECIPGVSLGLFVVDKVVDYRRIKTQLAGVEGRIQAAVDGAVADITGARVAAEDSAKKSQQRIAELEQQLEVAQATHCTDTLRLKTQAMLAGQQIKTVESLKAQVAELKTQMERAQRKGDHELSQNAQRSNEKISALEAQIQQLREGLAKAKESEVAARQKVIFLQDAERKAAEEKKDRESLQKAHEMIEGQKTQIGTLTQERDAFRVAKEEMDLLKKKLERIQRTTAAETRSVRETSRQEVQQEIEGLRAQVEALTKERDVLRVENEILVPANQEHEKAEQIVVGELRKESEALQQKVQQLTEELRTVRSQLSSQHVS